MSQNEEEFLQIVNHACARPALYTGRRDFFTLTVYLGAYTLGLQRGGKLARNPFDNLIVLSEHEHGFSHPGWGWWRHYLHDKVTDEQALKDFPQFLRQAMSILENRIKELDSTRPFNGTPPDFPQTAKYELPS